MSYCVKCGVELDEGAERCPLCGTPAWKPDETAPRYFPTKPAEVPRASRRAAAALLTAMLASVSLCCGLLNLILATAHPWSLYVAGAAVMLCFALGTVPTLFLLGVCKGLVPPKLKKYAARVSSVLVTAMGLKMLIAGLKLGNFI